MLKFPDGFLWGTATSAHQVEGNNTLNDWWDWEAAGHVKNREISGLACDHFNRFEEDFTLSQKLNLNAHRFSIEWSRVEPSEGEFSDSALYHYRQVLESLHRHKHVPMVTLLHFTLPRWVAEKGAWENEKILFWFERYVRKCAQVFGDLVPLWNTMNEPMVYMFEALMTGHWPPGKISLARQIPVMRRLIQAHAQAYHAIHDESQRNHWKSQVGLAVYYRLIQPWNPHSILDRWAASLRDSVFNQLFLNAIHTGIIGFPVTFNQFDPNVKGSWDFIGLNYYSRGKVRFSLGCPQFLFTEEIALPGTEKNFLGWEVYPEGLYDALVDLARFQKPIFVTENGICTDEDIQRQDFIKRHLRELYRAIQDGVDVRGYFHWSLIDNFEWAHGYAPHFGLAAVDPVSQRRFPRESARLYGEIARNNSLEL
ncbi:MAG: glycoside hydrolase family 1 protein [Candidatus Omnitrophica bacterium]|nr:glycoside hydrolase family 1 protein [Candidatus Omnitrophota bacterium]